MNAQNDTFIITIEEDGTITTKTGKMGIEVHQTAEEFLNEVTAFSGGTRTTKKLPQHHGHVHSHKHKGTHIHSHG